MKKNKVVLLIYALVLTAASVLLLIEGLIYTYYVILILFYSHIEILISFIFPATIGGIGMALAGYLLSNVTKAIILLLTKEETVEKSIDDAKPNKTQKSKTNGIRKRFISLHINCNITIVLFIFTYFYKTIVNGTWDKLYYIIPYVVGYGLVFMIIAMLVDKSPAKNKPKGKKRPEIQELFYLTIGMYCLIINIVVNFSLLYLIAFALLLALEFARFIYLIIYIFKNGSVEENSTIIEETNKKIELKIHPIFHNKDNNDKDDYSI